MSILNKENLTEIFRKEEWSEVCVVTVVESFSNETTGVFGPFSSTDKASVWIALMKERYYHEVDDAHHYHFLIEDLVTEVSGKEQHSPYPTD